jgi:queuine tRNA-ribosyltransferase
MSENNRRESWEISGNTLREISSGQLMHSQIGPWEEANAVYIAQSELNARVEEWVIYDVGMGIAANALAAFERLGDGQPARIVSFEKYPEALRQALRSPEVFQFLVPYRERIEKLLEAGQWQSAGSYWNLITGDFREAEITALPLADRIYFDFYAPSVCPELWTPEVFSKLLPKTKNDGLLITYSSTKAVRVALLRAGYFVGQGASTSMKKETTVASRSLSVLKAPLGAHWLAGYEKSPSCRKEVLDLIYAHPQFAPD